jgi:hypothetical protein
MTFKSIQLNKKKVPKSYETILLRPTANIILQDKQPHALYSLLQVANNPSIPKTLFPYIKGTSSFVFCTVVGRYAYIVIYTDFHFPNRFKKFLYQYLWRWALVFL